MKKNIESYTFYFENGKLIERTKRKSTALRAKYDQLTRQENLSLRKTNLKSIWFILVTTIVGVGLAFLTLTGMIMPPSAINYPNVNGDYRPVLAETTSTNTTAIPTIFTDLKTALKNRNAVKILDLSQQGLAHFPEEVLLFPNLEILNLADNKLEAIPHKISELFQLKILNLAGNRLTEIPTSIKDLPLTHIYLDENYFTKLPESIFDLEGLKVLSVCRNRLTAVSNKIGNLSQLAELRLWNNQIRNLPIELGELAQLEELDLRMNHLCYLPSTLERLGKLKKLLVADNRLTTVPLEIENMTNLTDLDLRMNAITDQQQELVKDLVTRNCRTRF